MEMHQVLTERGDPFLAVFGKILRKKTFTTSMYFVTTLTCTNNGSWHRVHLLHGGIGKVPGGLLTIQKVKEEASQVLSERGDPLFIVLWRKPPKMASRHQFILLQMDRLQLTAVYCNRRGV